VYCGPLQVAPSFSRVLFFSSYNERKRGMGG
jgi:hypothetical protein